MERIKPTFVWIKLLMLLASSVFASHAILYSQEVEGDLTKLMAALVQTSGKDFCDANVQLGRYYRLKVHNPDSSIHYLSEALKCCNVKKYPKLEVAVLQRMANHYAKYGREEYALSLMNKSIKMADSLGLPDRRVTNRIKGYCLNALNQQDSAYFYYKKELEISKDVPLEVLYTCQYLVDLLCSMGLANEAEEYVDLGIQQKDKVSIIDYMVFLQSATDFYTVCLPDAKSFVEYEVEAIELSKSFEGFNRYYHSESVVLNRNELSARAEFYQKAIAELKEQNHMDAVKNLYVRLIKLYENDGNSEEIIRIANASLSWLDQAGQDDPQVRAFFWELLYEAHKKEGHLTEALQALESYHIILDTLEKYSHIEQIRALETKYQTAKKELQIDEQKRELNKKKSQFRWIISLSSLLLFLSYLLWRNQKQKSHLLKRDKELQATRIEDLEKQKRIISLSSMIDGQESERDRISKDLHDGLGSLLSATKAHYSKIKQNAQSKEDADAFIKANELMDTACSELRRISHNLMPPILRSQGLITAISSLITQFKEAHDIEVEYEFRDMEKKLNQTQEVFLYRIIQELFQNIVKHAQANKAELSIY